jgi:nucleotidyltransferase substrate binding protein (TIGR01987 family)
MSETHPNSDLVELDVSSFGRALQQLDIALDALSSNPDDSLIRDAVIQRFEFAYELAVRSLKRYLRAVAISEDEIIELSFKDMIRRADSLGVLRTGWPEWGDYRQARTDTVHTYNEIRAVEVAGVAKNFAEEARVLLNNLSRRIKGE